jgi:WD40 repeat protein
MHALALTSDGRWLAAGLWDGTVLVWDLASGGTRRELKGHTRDVRSLAFAGDGKSLISGSDDGTARLWDASTGAELVTLKDPDGKKVRHVSITADASTALTTTSLGDTLRPGPKVTVWDVKKGTARAAHASEDGSGTAGLVIAPDGSFFAELQARTIYMRDVKTGKILKQLAEHEYSVSRLRISADGKTLFAGGINGHLAAWDARSGTRLWEVKGHDSAIQCVAISGDGRRALSTSTGNRIKVWDVKAGKELAAVPRELGDVTDAAFTTDGKVVIFDRPGTVEVWDTDAFIRRGR